MDIEIGGDGFRFLNLGNSGSRRLIKTMGFRAYKVARRGWLIELS